MDHYHVRHEIDAPAARHLLLFSEDYIVRHSFDVNELRQIVRLLEQGATKEMVNTYRSLSELYIEVNGKILVIGVGYGGPKVNIKVYSYLQMLFIRAIQRLGVIEKYQFSNYISGDTLVVKLLRKGSELKELKNCCLVAIV